MECFVESDTAGGKRSSDVRWRSGEGVLAKSVHDGCAPARVDLPDYPSQIIPRLATYKLYGIPGLPLQDST